MKRKAETPGSGPIGERIRQVRLAAGLDRRQMSRRLDIEHTSYNKYETGIRAPGPRVLSLLAADFDVSIDWLLYGKGVMYFGDRVLRAQMERSVEEGESRCLELERRVEELSVDTVPGITSEVCDMVRRMLDNPALYHHLMYHYQTYRTDNPQQFREPGSG